MRSYSFARIKRFVLQHSLVSILCLAVAVVTFLTACSGPGGGSTGKFTEMLQLVPDLPQTRRYVVINDYARARELYGISAPGPDADEKAIMSYLQALYGPQNSLGENTFIGGVQYFPKSPIRRKNVGFGPQDVDMDVHAGAPAAFFDALKGRFDPKATDDAISRCEQCPSVARELYVRKTYRDITIHSWGDDGNIMHVNAWPLMQFAPPVFDNSGRAQPMAVESGRVLTTTSTEGVKLMIDLSQGRSSTIQGVTVSSLAAAEEFRLMAESLEGLGAYSVLLSDWTETLKDYKDLKPYQESYPDLEKSPLLRPYQTFATGIGQDSKGSYMTLVLVHANADIAKQNADLLRRRIEETSLVEKKPWRELVESTEIRTEGRVLLAKLRGERAARVWLTWALGRFPLLLMQE